MECSCANLLATWKAFDEAVQTISWTRGQRIEKPARPPLRRRAAAAQPPPAGTPFWGPFLEWIASPIFEVFVDAGVVMVLVIFMLSSMKTCEIGYSACPVKRM